MSRSILLSVLLTASASVSATTLIDGSFETPNLGSGNYSYMTQPDGWSGNGALINGQGSSPWYGAAPPAGQDGSQFYGLQGTDAVFQNFLATSGKLTVSWLSGGRPNFGSYAGDQSYIVSVTGSGIENGSLGTYTTLSGQAFVQQSGTISVTAGQTYAITFRGLSPSDETAFIDNVAVADSVPEAGIWSMMIAGFGLVGAASRRRQGAVA